MHHVECWPKRYTDPHIVLRRQRLQAVLQALGFASYEGRVGGLALAVCTQLLHGRLTTLRARCVLLQLQSALEFTL